MEKELCLRLWTLPLLVAAAALLPAACLLLRQKTARTAFRQKLDGLKKEHVRQLAETAVNAQEEERARIGRDLHDDLGSSLAALRLIISMPAYEQLDAASFKALQERCRKLVDEISASARTVAHNLSALSLELYGLPAAVDDLADRAFSAGLELQFRNEAGTEVDKLAPRTALALYRVLEELLANTIRHAQASAAWLTFSVAGAYLLVHYRDDGRGADPNAAPGMGMSNIRQRLLAVDAHHTVRTAAGEGFSVNIELKYI